MRVIVHRSADAAAAAVAQFLAEALREQPSLALGLPSGRTPAPMYRALAALADQAAASFSEASVYGLDEFLGVSADDPRSYAAYFHRALFDRVDLDPRRVHLLDGAARHPEREARRFERALAASGGLDIVVVGIGMNGHIGFNEPAASISANTHVVRLHPRTRRANAAAFGGWRRVPTHALSMGIGTILRARAVILLATGAAKARIVARACQGSVSTRVPASLLQLHPNVAVVLDRAAARGLVER